MRWSGDEAAAGGGSNELEDGHDGSWFAERQALYLRLPTMNSSLNMIHCTTITSLEFLLLLLLRQFFEFFEFFEFFS